MPGTARNPAPFDEVASLRSPATTNSLNARVQQDPVESTDVV